MSLRFMFAGLVGATALGGCVSADQKEGAVLYQYVPAERPDPGPYESPVPEEDRAILKALAEQQKQQKAADAESKTELGTAEEPGL